MSKFTGLNIFWQWKNCFQLILLDNYVDILYDYTAVVVNGIQDHFTFLRFDVAVYRNCRTLKNYLLLLF